MWHLFGGQHRVLFAGWHLDNPEKTVLHFLSQHFHPFHYATNLSSLTCPLRMHTGLQLIQNAAC